MTSVAHDETILDDTLTAYTEVFIILAQAVDLRAIARSSSGPARRPGIVGPEDHRG